VIDLEAARELLDMGKRIGGGPRAEQQLQGAVAIHNILERHGRAYLADEVGMGKTYVALGAIALFRHFNPNFRILVIAPRQNIQKKWQKELTNFVAHNVRFPDLRIAAPGGRLARPLVSCENLVSLVGEVSVDPQRDFFIRMTSFSLASGDGRDDLKKQRDKLKKQLPWLDDAAFDLRNKQEFKKNFARALCCALPHFDLVIVDEAHNLKHGFSLSGSARNQLLAEALGRPNAGDVPNPRNFPGYGPRAHRVLFLSATPLEDAYRQIWNQLDVFGLATGLEELKSEGTTEERKRELAAQFMVRRVTTIRTADRDHTKNMYRREWRAGGVAKHDEPIGVTDSRQRLVVALVQKKVSELLSGKRFSHSFQIGMLASFESFLETARLKRDDVDEPIFDDGDQTDKPDEREGLDVRDLNRLARHYKRTFGREMPHPKMDAVVQSLADAWLTGKKSLVFVRRVASVKELKQKLDERYDDWLISHLHERLPTALHADLDAQIALYQQQKAGTKLPAAAAGADDTTDDEDAPELADDGGEDTFFAWFFRGDGPSGVVSGANIQKRFTRSSGAYATFFADNHVMTLLGATPGTVATSLAAALGCSAEELKVQLRQRAAAYISSQAKTVTRGARMEAAQAAGIELLAEDGPLALRESAQVIYEERYRASRAQKRAKEAPPEIMDALETETFFTRLRRPEHAALRQSLWPEPQLGATEAASRPSRLFKEQELRAQFLSTAARLGHAFIDLYCVAMNGRSTLALRGDDANDEGVELGSSATGLLDRYLELLEQQRQRPDGRWDAWRELSDVAHNFELILDVNTPEALNQPLSGMSREVAALLRQQQPVGGMAGQVNQTLLRQFRMPGYPFVLITTDLLQEGEDLHTFCSSVLHYGISWTPSAMEQRIGRIDRVRSQTDRRLAGRTQVPQGFEWLQVHYPHLEDTVEVLQVERVLNRVNTFLRLMHDGLQDDLDPRKVDVKREMAAPRRRVSAYLEPLKSAFPLPEWATRGDVKALAVPSHSASQLLARIDALRSKPLEDLHIDWSPSSADASWLGTVSLSTGRRQPFTLVLRAEQGLPVLRCISPIGRVHPENDPEAIAALAARCPPRVGALPTREARSYDLTVEDDVLLSETEYDAARAALLIRRVSQHADRMEHEHFAGERDGLLAEFQADLLEEVQHGN
jgi:Type III restriction enzyme, res subunit/Helicase conserved C-terminal domain